VLQQREPEPRAARRARERLPAQLLITRDVATATRTVIDLQSGSTYHYRLVAYSNNGLYVGPDHTFTTKHVARSRPVVRIYAGAHRGSHVDTIAIHGRLQLPASVPSKAACNGTIALQLDQGNTTVALRHVQVHGNCTFAVNVHVTANRIHTNRALSLTGYYWGNTELLPTTHRQSLHI